MPITQDGLRVFNKNWKKMFVGEGYDIILMTKVKELPLKWYESLYRIIFNKPLTVFRHFDEKTGKLLACYEEIPGMRIPFTDPVRYDFPAFKEDSPMIYIAAIVDKDDYVLVFFKFPIPQEGIVGSQAFINDFDIDFV